jgi:hypothetical protein
MLEKVFSAYSTSIYVLHTKGKTVVGTPKPTKQLEGKCATIILPNAAAARVAFTVHHAGTLGNISTVTPSVHPTKGIKVHIRNPADVAASTGINVKQLRISGTGLHCVEVTIRPVQPAFKLRPQSFQLRNDVVEFIFQVVSIYLPPLDLFCRLVLTLNGPHQNRKNKENWEDYFFHCSFLFNTK